MSIDLQNPQVSTTLLQHNKNKSDVDDRRLLIDSMQLVELKKDTFVPNYLVDTKIYSQLSKNAIVQAQPAEIHFAGFDVNKTIVKKVVLTNVSSKVETFHIIPPQSKYFILKYTKPDRLVPGFGIECDIHFTGSELRYYYDNLRIHTKDEEHNIIIPIHAYPVVNLQKIPEFVKFPNVPVGKKEILYIPLKSRGPVDFDFVIKILQDHPSFHVSPKQGILPKYGEVEIEIIFSPCEFVTAHMTLEISLSQFNFQSCICHVSGYSEPGLERQAICEENGEELMEDSTALYAPCISPAELARARRLKLSKISINNRRTLGKNDATKSMKSSQMTSISKAESIYAQQDGFRIPKYLNSPAAVAKVLNQQKGKMRLNELRDVLHQAVEDEFNATKQMKETLFEQFVRQNVYEERQNQLRWQVRLGELAMEQDAKEKILSQRELAWNIYQRRRGDPNIVEELRLTRSLMTFTRTRRAIINQEEREILEKVARFDPLQNNNWTARKSALQRFRKGAWKMIYQLRADKRLVQLKQLVNKVNEFGIAEESRLVDALAPVVKVVYPFKNESLIQERRFIRKAFATSESAMDPSQLAEAYHQKRLNEILIEQQKLGTNQSENINNQSEDFASDAQMPASAPYYVPPAEIIQKQHYDFYQLAVPQQYRLCNYQRIDSEECGRTYVPPSDVQRLLRVGAQNEVVTVAAAATEEKNGLNKRSNSRSEKPFGMNKPPQVNFKPPNGVFEPIPFSPLYSFNPSPRLQALEQPRPFMESNMDSAVCPLQLYKGSNSEQLYLDHKEIMSGGIMNWRKFPSASLIALSATATLTQVWLPRWNDPFSDGILPQGVPSLLESLPEQDAANVQFDESAEADVKLTATSTMVSDEFPVIKTLARRWQSQLNAIEEESVIEEVDGRLKKLTLTPDREIRPEPQVPTVAKLATNDVPNENAGLMPRWTCEFQLDKKLRQQGNRMSIRAAQRLQQLQSAMKKKLI